MAVNLDVTGVAGLELQVLRAVAEKGQIEGIGKLVTILEAHMHSAGTRQNSVFACTEATKTLIVKKLIRARPYKGVMLLELTPECRQILSKSQTTGILRTTACAASAVALIAACSSAPKYGQELPPAVRTTQYSQASQGPVWSPVWSYCDGECPEPTRKTIKIENPAPVRQLPAVPAAQPKPKIQTLEADVVFDFGSDALKPAGQKLLEDLGKQLKEGGIRSVIVVGHTDRIGSAEFNMNLSSRRAEKVKKLLATFVTTSNIQAEGRGAKEPVTEGKCSRSLPRDRLLECLAPDRRVEVVITQKVD